MAPATAPPSSPPPPPPPLALQPSQATANPPCSWVRFGTWALLMTKSERTSNSIHSLKLKVEEQHVANDTVLDRWKRKHVGPANLSQVHFEVVEYIAPALAKLHQWGNRRCHAKVHQAISRTGRWEYREQSENWSRADKWNATETVHQGRLQAVPGRGQEDVLSKQNIVMQLVMCHWWDTYSEKETRPLRDKYKQSTGWVLFGPNPALVTEFSLQVLDTLPLNIKL